MAQASLLPIVQTAEYEGNSDLLMLWGLGEESRSLACKKHLANGGRAILWDIGYFGREEGYARLSIDYWHVQHLDITRPKPSRWQSLGIQVTDQSSQAGHIVLVGMGPKSHTYTKEYEWEENKLAELRKRFPSRHIVFRPKPGKPIKALDCDVAAGGPIADVLRGASLVVCRHSNVAVDAVALGIPFECEDGAAKWLSNKPYTEQTRQDFLHRLAWWQWLPSESVDAWKFILGIINAS
jgi:hypothetical protein